MFGFLHQKTTKLRFCPHNLQSSFTYHVLLNRIDNCSSILLSTYFVWGSFLCEFMLFKVQTAKSYYYLFRNSVNSTVLIHAHKGVFWSDLVCWWFGESCYISLLILAKRTYVKFLKLWKFKPKKSIGSG